jgi:hypothetical protein
LWVQAGSLRPIVGALTISLGSIAALPLIYLLSFANFAPFVKPALAFSGVPSNQKVSRFGGFVS